MRIKVNAANCLNIAIIAARVSYDSQPAAVAVGRKTEY